MFTVVNKSWFYSSQNLCRTSLKQIFPYYHNYCYANKLFRNPCRARCKVERGLYFRTKPIFWISLPLFVFCLGTLAVITTFNRYCWIGLDIRTVCHIPDRWWGRGELFWLVQMGIFLTLFHIHHYQFQIIISFLLSFGTMLEMPLTTILHINQPILGFKVTSILLATQ